MNDYLFSILTELLGLFNIDPNVRDSNALIFLSVPILLFLLVFFSLRLGYYILRKKDLNTFVLLIITLIITVVIIGVSVVEMRENFNSFFEVFYFLFGLPAGVIFLSTWLFYALLLFFITSLFIFAYVGSKVSFETIEKKQKYLADFRNTKPIVSFGYGYFVLASVFIGILMVSWMGAEEEIKNGFNEGIFFSANSKSRAERGIYQKGEKIKITSPYSFDILFKKEEVNILDRTVFFQKHFTEETEEHYYIDSLIEDESGYDDESNAYYYFLPAPFDGKLTVKKTVPKQRFDYEEILVRNTNGFVSTKNFIVRKGESVYISAFPDTCVYSYKLGFLKKNNVIGTDTAFVSPGDYAPGFDHNQLFLKGHNPALSYFSIIGIGKKHLINKLSGSELGLFVFSLWILLLIYFYAKYKYNVPYNWYIDMYCNHIETRFPDYIFSESTNEEASNTASRQDEENSKEYDLSKEAEEPEVNYYEVEEIESEEKMNKDLENIDNEAREIIETAFEDKIINATQKNTFLSSWKFQKQQVREGNNIEAVSKLLDSKISLLNKFSDLTDSKTKLIDKSISLNNAQRIGKLKNKLEEKKLEYEISDVEKKTFDNMNEKNKEEEKRKGYEVLAIYRVKLRKANCTEDEIKEIENLIEKGTSAERIKEICEQILSKPTEEKKQKEVDKLKSAYESLKDLLEIEKWIEEVTPELVDKFGKKGAKDILDRLDRKRSENEIK